MGSFVYMIARDDADIIEEKRPEFEERLEKVFNAAGMMEQEHLTLFGKGIRALRPVRIENGYTTFFYNYFEDDVWENAGYYNKNGGVYSEKVGWRNFARAIEAAYGRTLMEHNISPHIFRHWYTVQLVLSGVNDPGTLMYYRGDKSPESALTYLQNKSELEKQFRKVNNEIFNYSRWAAEERHDRY